MHTRAIFLVYHYTVYISLQCIQYTVYRQESSFTLFTFYCSVHIFGWDTGKCWANVQDGVLGSSLESGYNMGLPESRVILGGSVLNLWKSGKVYLGGFTNLLQNMHPCREDYLSRPKSLFIHQGLCWLWILKRSVLLSKHRWKWSERLCSKVEGASKKHYTGIRNHQKLNFLVVFLMEDAHGIWTSTIPHTKTDTWSWCC